MPFACRGLPTSGPFKRKSCATHTSLGRRSYPHSSEHSLKSLQHTFTYVLPHVANLLASLAPLSLVRLDAIKRHEA
jgi:hypothetical protein